jgi:MFS family permease
MSDAAARRVLWLLSAAELLAMSLWFTGTAIVAPLSRNWPSHLLPWITIAVQIGFVAGALVIAAFNLNDHFRAPRVFVVSAVLAAAANAGFGLLADGNIPAALLCRGLTGAFLAGVYPTGMKIMAGWFQRGRGFALGLLIGALTVGSAIPHVLEGTARGASDWHLPVYSASALAVLGALLVAFGVHEGPYAAKQPPFHFGQIGEMLTNRRLRLANLGYFGHMWELYGMWTWIGAMLVSSRWAPFLRRGQRAFLAPVTHSSFPAELLAGVAIGIGVVGCVWAGWAADRFPSGELPTRQRADVTIIAMAVSGACCLVAAAVFEHFWWLVAVALVWGISVIADSAQFSAIVSEVSDQRYVGTALTTQTALGFLLTTVSIRAIFWISQYRGWPLAIAALALGPATGIVAMWRLRRAPYL